MKLLVVSCLVFVSVSSQSGQNDDKCYPEDPRANCGEWKCKSLWLLLSFLFAVFVLSLFLLQACVHLGYFGITKSDCEDVNNCCWQESDKPVRKTASLYHLDTLLRLSIIMQADPWCFRKADEDCKAVADEAKVDCGKVLARSKFLCPALAVVAQVGCCVVVAVVIVQVIQESRRTYVKIEAAVL